MKLTGGALTAKTVGRYAAMGLSIGLYGLYTAFNWLGAAALKAHTILEAWIKVPLPKAPEPPPIPPEAKIKVKIKGPPPT